MEQELGKPYEPPSGSPIHTGAELIMSVIANERAKASQGAEARLASMAKYLEEYKAWSGKNQAHEAVKLAASQKRVFELEQQFTHLQSLKTEDELVIQSMAGQIEALKQERDYLHTELSSSLNNQRMASAASVDLVSDLAKYDIWLWGANSLSFGDQWLQLWNQYVSEDPQTPDRGLSQNDRVAPKELAILLENFASQVRRDKDRIQSQQETISSLARDREYLFSLYNNDPKALPYPAPTETNSQTPDSEIQTSSPYSFSGHQEYYSETQPSAIKSEPSFESPDGPPQVFGPSEPSGGPS